MNPLPEPAPRRWRLPVLLLLGSALLLGSFVIAVLALPLRADDGTPKPPQSDSLGDKIGHRVVVVGHVDTREGVSAVLPLQPGRVAKVTAKENEDYGEGAELYAMDDRQARFDRDQAQTALNAAEAQRDDAKTLPAQHRAAIAAQQAGIAAKEKSRDAAQRNADDAKRLAEKNLASAEKADAAQRLADAAAREVDVENQKLKALEAQDPEIAVKRAELDVTAKKTQLAKAQWALDECTVKAPFKGKVLRLQVSVGDLLPNPRQVPILYCSTAPRIIRAEVEQEFEPSVKVSQKAYIKDYANEKEYTWKGEVESKSDWYTHRRSMLLEPLQFNDVRTLECIIKINSGQEPLKIGQRVRVTLPVE
jgi:multidrug resistance efflux pump